MLNLSSSFVVSMPFTSPIFLLIQLPLFQSAGLRCRGTLADRILGEWECSQVWEEEEESLNISSTPNLVLSCDEADGMAREGRIAA